MTASLTSDDLWLASTTQKAERAFAAAEATADRLVWLRELARLRGGRTFPPGGVDLSASERSHLGRFGLALAQDGAVRILDEDLSDIAPDLRSALQIDIAARGGVLPAPPDAALLRLTSHDAYRSRTQKAAAQSILTLPGAANLMVSMPTGAGKSLLFQLPILWRRETEPGACAIVIVPTIALAEDHQRTLSAIPGLETCRALSGSTPMAERAEVLARFRNGDIPLLLLSPEAAFGTARADLLQCALPPEAPDKYGQTGRLIAVFIDEAHIIESWGRSFRPDFQRLPALVRDLRVRNPALNTILLSATLTPAARTVLRADYGGEAWGEIHAEVPRYQFDLSAAAFPDEASRSEALLRLVDRAPRPAVIYTTRVEHAESLHDHLRQSRGYRRLAHFTGAISSASERRRIVEDWARGDLDLVIATSAFGLGVDKSDVRAVIHACLPEGAPRWYQEVGRASRDGHQGLGVMLWIAKGDRGFRRPSRRTEEDSFQSDEDDAESMAGGGWLSRDLAEARWTALLRAAKADGRDPETGALRLILPLDAARDGLDARYTGERNRGWNRSLLNLLQRQGALTVEAEAPTSEDLPTHWPAAIALEGLLDPLDRSAWEAAWDVVFRGRDREVAQARNDLHEFIAIVRRGDRECLLRGAYRLMEPDAAAEPCGRCPACRARGRPVPIALQPRGAEFAWPLRQGSGAALPRGVLLIAPEGDRQRLIERLAQAGVEQVIAAESEAAQIAHRLAQTPARLGLVQAAEDFLAREGVVPDLPTALLPPAQASLAPWLRELNRLARSRPHQTFLLVADPHQRIEGRMLHQIASQHAPYDEAMLDSFAAPPPIGDIH